MHLPKLYKLLSLLLWTPGWASCGCYDPSPAFPLPKLDGKITELEQAFTNIKASIERTVAATEYDTTSFSFEVTSSKSTLFALYHTAKHQDPSRPGASSVNGTSAYRIASCTKVFTVLAILQQHAKGALHLDDAVNKYLPELEEKQSGTLPWHDITLRALGSQLSGIPGDLLQVDLINSKHNPEDLGLPPKSRKGLPTCGEYASFTKICEKDDLIRELRKGKPTFAPAQQSSYCNVGFEILGLVLEKVTKQPYTEYIHSMLNELDIEAIKFDKPADGIAVLPANETSYWDVEMGVHNPTGGLYSSSSELSKFLRYVLTHYNGITPGALNWLHPVSYSYGINSFYGMPWEIFRSADILKHSRKPVTFVTKGGGVPAYSSIIIMVPEYDLGITILVAGKGKLLNEIRRVFTEELIPAVEDLAQKQLAEKYVGTYKASEEAGINSSLELSHSPSSGLYISRFISNGTEGLKVWFPSLIGSDDFDPEDWRMQLIPTMLFAEPKNQEGELWRALLVPQKRTSDVWDDFCSLQVDVGRYAGKILNELVVWTDAADRVAKVELPGFEVTLHKADQQPQQVGQRIAESDQRPFADQLWTRLISPIQQINTRFRQPLKHW